MITARQYIPKVNLFLFLLYQTSLMYYIIITDLFKKKSCLELSISMYREYQLLSL